MHPYVFLNQNGAIRRNGRHLDLYNFLHAPKNNIVDYHEKIFPKDEEQKEDEKLK